MFHSVPWICWVLLLKTGHGFFKYMTLKAYCTLEFEGVGVASHYVIYKNYLESRYSTTGWVLYWGVKLKTITERSCFVLLNWFSSSSVFKISSHPNSIRELVQRSLTQLRDLEGQKQKFIAIHSVFVFPNPRSSRKLRTFIEWLRETGSG